MDEMFGVVINGRRLVVCKNGEVYGFGRYSNEMYLIENVANHSDGYNQIGCGGKLICRHRIMGYTFLGLDINNPKDQIDHIDGNRSNNSIDNLRIVNNQQNQWNQIRAKGYYWVKRANKWQAQIILNGKKIYLGCYSTESEAHTAYLKAKLIYHKII
jgi:hypothetical protein